MVFFCFSRAKLPEAKCGVRTWSDLIGGFKYGAHQADVFVRFCRPCSETWLDCARGVCIKFMSAVADVTVPTVLFNNLLVG